MTPNELFAEFATGFPARRFTAGLLLAFIDLYIELGIPGTKAKSYEQVAALFPRQTVTNGGKRANTLILRKSDGSTLSLRPFYNAAERFFRADHKRFDYPLAHLMQLRHGATISIG